MDSETTDTLPLEVVTDSSSNSRKRHLSPNTSATSSVPVVKRRSVSYSTFNKWRGELDKECQTLSWLDCEFIGKGAKRVVEKLKCNVCIRYKSRIESRRNYSDKWLMGADSVRTSNIRDHARSDQHIHAMSIHYKMADGNSISREAEPTIVSMLQEIPQDTRSKLRKKFEIAYFVATQKLAYSKYPAICELEKHHGVNIGSTYLNSNACKTFCKFIAESKRLDLCKIIANAKFFSILMDGSTDISNIDEEMFLVLWCDVDGNDEKVHSRMQFFSVLRPDRANAAGLFECLQKSLQQLGVSVISAENCKRLIGIGTDGASANIAAAGLKGLVEKEIPWIFWMWCLAHRVELALKDALKHTTFDLIHDMLIRLYYIQYMKNPRKNAASWKK